MEGTIGLSIDQKKLMEELVNGMEIAKRLKTQIRTDSSYETVDVLVQTIVSSYEKALLLLNWSEPEPSITAQQSQLPLKAITGVPESPPSINGSPRSDDFDAGVRDNVQDCNIPGSKKRKMLPRWTEHVRISPDRGLEGPQDDGYNWRKYGQKDILGAKYPRSYYRCTYRNTQGCWATKQVQRSDDDPTIFEVTYKGTHTCLQVIPTSASPDKRETKPKRNATADGLNYQNDILQNLRSNLTVNTEWFDQNNDDANVFSFNTSSFQSFSTAANTTTSGFGGFCNAGISEPSDFAGLMSANTSTSSSPMFNVDFSVDPTVEIDANFHFDNSLFFY